MDKNLLVLLLLFHVIGDFYLQNDSLAENKKSSFRYILLHCAIIFASMLVLVIPILDITLLIYLGVFVASHLLIDVIKFLLGKKLNDEKNAGRLYVIDQFLHIAAILLLSLIYGQFETKLTEWSIFGMSGSIPINSIKGILVILMILKPTNITFRELFGHTKPVEDVDNDDTRKVGKLIGNLERLLVCVLLYLNQYTAIGLVFTAKSITRYNKISEKQDFAEYYLLGTLFSILSTIIVFELINRL